MPTRHNTYVYRKIMLLFIKKLAPEKRQLAQKNICGVKIFCKKPLYLNPKELLQKNTEQGL